MKDQPQSQSSSTDNSDVDSIIAKYLASVDRGENISPSEIIANHPEIAHDLRKFFADGNLLFPWATRSAHDYKPWESTPTIAHNFGDYELKELIGTGGMGLVYRATQRSLQRDVAIKLIRRDSVACDDDVARFRREAEFASKLDHPAIVAILDFGRFEDTYYMVMNYVPGPTLATVLTFGPLTPMESAKACVEICEGLIAAHQMGIIHRDLKPSNILLKPIAECESFPKTSPHAHSIRDYRMRITDFGLAKMLTDNTTITRSGEVLGTPCYMAPEQASGNLASIGTWTDLYAVGAILYNMLTGRPPFQADSVFLTLQHVIASDAVPPRLLNRAIPKELDSICMKCLHKDPQRRYASATELLQDLNRFMRGEPIHARSPDWWARLEFLVQQERRDDYFRGWGPALITIGCIVLVSHILIEALQVMNVVGWQAYFLPRVAMFGGLASCLFYFRRYSIWPINSVERLVWMVWMAYLMAIGAVNASRLVMGRPQIELYPVFAAIAGAAFLLMGSQIWRGCYAISIAFFCLAPLTARWLHFAPLAFGGMWGIAFLALGFRFLRDSRGK